MPDKLRMLHHDDVVRTYDLGKRELTIGRAANRDIVLRNDAVSREHARLVFENGVYELEDTDSRNGVFINGRRITSKVPLKDRDQFTICGSTFELQSSSPRARAREDDASSVTCIIDATGSHQSILAASATEKLEAILQITQALGCTLDTDAVLAKILDGLFDIFRQADRGLVLLSENGHLVPKATKHRRSQQDDIQYSRTIVEQAMNSRQAVLSTDATTDQHIASTESLIQSHIRSVMCVPLLSQEMKPLGVVQLDTQSVARKFSPEDMGLLVSVASQAAVAVEYARAHKELFELHALQREMKLARQVQRALLAQSMPEVEDYAFWAYYEPARHVAGDFYDFLKLSGGRQAVLVADVAGKGVPAALLMAKASAICKVALLHHPDDLGLAVSEMNDEICNAPGAEYGTVTAGLQSGECVVMYTDGISEAENDNNQQYTIARVQRQLSAVSGQSPTETGQALLDDVRRHMADCEQSDDISLVVFGRKR